ncbi:phosphatase PAP2 family protein, partial [Candidatus Woesearchaeota archaeon]|nr:phosphatase PAP2 family protein [Candidatus Woesearchaeota archaeon]
SVGVIVAYSRMYLEKHDIVDVAVGSVIGILVGLLVVALL